MKDKSSSHLLNKKNLVCQTSERWRPPNFRPETSRSDHLAASLRRYLDLQAGSAWRDLKVLLRSCQGCLLDVGCGAQPFRPLVPADVHYVGIDTAQARARFGYDIPDTLYFEGAVWPIADRSIDTILCTEALEHVLEPGDLLAEARRCLKPGGRLLITVPFSARWHYIPYDYWRFTPSSLDHLLTRFGFTDVAVFARGDHITVACYKAMALFTPLLFPQDKSPALSLCKRLIGLILSPLFFGLAVIGNVSLRARAGDDCLGYTVVATG